jgi:hypothetical protein
LSPLDPASKPASAVGARTVAFDAAKNEANACASHTKPGEQSQSAVAAAVAVTVAVAVAVAVAVVVKFTHDKLLIFLIINHCRSVLQCPKTLRVINIYIYIIGVVFRLGTLHL